MRPVLTSVNVIMCCLLMTILSCDSESSDPTTRLNSISSEEEAQVVIDALYNFWELSVKGSMPEQTVWPEQIAVVDYETTDSPGTAHLTGEVKFAQESTQNSTSSTSSRSTVIDTDCNFSQNYTYDGVKFNGTVTFQDMNSDYNVCTWSFFNNDWVCYGGANIWLTINATKLNVEFDYNGKKISDVITIEGKREVSTWAVIIKNKNGTEFNLSY